MKKKKEVEYYNEIAQYLIDYIESNINNENIVVSVLRGEISSAINTLISNGYDAGEDLENYAVNVQRLHLDISLLLENKSTGLFEIVIFEVKRVSTLGLAHLSQLIGYCLVSKCEFGILLNVDKGVSDQFSSILNTDKDLTSIHRVIGNKSYHHKFGVMVWDSFTKKIDYSNTGSIGSLPELLEMMCERIN